MAVVIRVGSGGDVDDVWRLRVRELYSAEGGYLCYLAMEVAGPESVKWRHGKGIQVDSDS